MKTGQSSLKYVQFLSAFFSNPLQTGSLLPSSKYLAKSIMRGIDFSQCKHVIEYGPGSGAFTRFLAPILESNDAHLHLVEMNTLFSDQLRKRFPGAKVHRGTASDVLKFEGVSQGVADVVISSLPFTTIPWKETKLTLAETYQLLKPGGIFRTYLYFNTMPLAKNRLLLEYLNKTFDSVNIWREWRNFPPAFVIECRKRH